MFISGEFISNQKEGNAEYRAFSATFGLYQSFGGSLRKCSQSERGHPCPQYRASDENFRFYSTLNLLEAFIRAFALKADKDVRAPTIYQRSISSGSI
ncbi:MAG: hypothetical protein ACR2IA_02460 [Pyrinomonadaceae bacterium]